MKKISKKLLCLVVVCVCFLVIEHDFSAPENHNVIVFNQPIMIANFGR